MLWPAICATLADMQAIPFHLQSRGGDVGASPVSLATTLLLSSSSRRSRGPQPTAPHVACRVNLQVAQYINKGPRFRTLLRLAIPTSLHTKTLLDLTQAHDIGPTRAPRPLPRVQKNTSLLEYLLFRLNIGRHPQLDFPIRICLALANLH
jgi:hypothetical protein